MNEIFEKMKKDNVAKVFNTSLDRVRTTRKELTELCDLSFVTVSRICDKLLELDILKQSYTTDRSASRRSRILSVKDKYWIGVYVLEPDMFTLNVCDLSLRILYSYKFFPEDKLFFDDTVIKFAAYSESSIKKKTKNKICCGTAILVPGEYNEKTDTVPSSPIRRLRSVKIKNTFKGRTFGTEPLVYSLYSAYAKETQLSLRPEDQHLSLFLNKGHLECTYILSDSKRPIQTKHFGILKTTNKRTLDKFASKAPDPHGFFSHIANIIFTLINTVGITHISVSGNLYSKIDTVALVLSKHVAELCNEHMMIPPTVSVADIKPKGVRYISREIRTSWFADSILEEDLS